MECLTKKTKTMVCHNIHYIQEELEKIGANNIIDVKLTSHYDTKMGKSVFGAIIIFEEDSDVIRNVG